MKINLIKVGTYQDGGTILYRGSDQSLYYEDHREDTKTDGEIYNSYPSEPWAEIVDKSNFKKIILNPPTKKEESS